MHQKRELEYASRQLTSIEINGTFYGSQKPATYAKWHDEAPDGFVFAVKAPRFATNRKALAEAGGTIQRFFSSGITELNDKLGPVNWQFMPTKQFDAGDLRAFLELLPREAGGRTLRHAVEARHVSFRNPEFIGLLREYGVAAVIAGDSVHPQIADATAPFVYARIMGTQQTERAGYPDSALDLWASRARTWAGGTAPDGLEYVVPPRAYGSARDVFLYVIGGFKERNPAAARSLLQRLE